MEELIKHSFLHMIEDVPTLFLFLFVTYFLLGLIENTSEEKSKNAIAKAGKFSPVIGATLGAFPQCGFSAAASNFYSAGIINLGTLIAVFMSTSDEMLPVFLAEKVSISVIGKIIGIKVVIATITGYVLYFATKTIRKKYENVDEGQMKILLRESSQNKKQNEYCSMHGQVDEDSNHCSHYAHKHHNECTAIGLTKGALIHSVRITLFIMIISFFLNMLLGLFGNSLKDGGFAAYPYISIFVSALVGLIPNCAASVIISQLYIEGVLCTGAMLSGLLVSAGVGLLVLFKENKQLKENLIILGVLYGAGVIWGLIFQIMGFNII